MEFKWCYKRCRKLRLNSWSKSVSSDSLGELDVSGHDGDSLGVNGAQVGVFEEGDEVSLSSFLEGQDGGALESKFLLELVSNFSDESLEGKFSDEEVSGLLVFSDFSEGDCSGFESVGFLDTGGDGSALSGDFLSDKLFSGHLLGGALSGSLFCSSHVYKMNVNFKAALLIWIHKYPLFL